MTRSQSNPDRSGEDPDLAGRRAASNQQQTSSIQHRASSNQSALLIFAKYPEPGKVKTRLAASLGDQAAALLYEKFVRRILQIGERAGASHMFVAATPAARMADFQKKFSGNFSLIAQAESTHLGDRMIAAAKEVASQGYNKILIIGTDSPDLPLAYLEEANAALEVNDVVLGPAEDGGYYLIGLKEIHPALFDGITWSSNAVLVQTLERARRLNVRVHLLPFWYDVDDLPSYERLLRANPEFGQW